MKNLLHIHLDPKRIYGLDIIRALAILFVVMEHGVYLFPLKYYRIQSYFIFDGVSIFFVLSGFLIGSIFINTAEKNSLTKAQLLNFWKRRWFRTLPNYFFILIVLLILQLIFKKRFEAFTIGQYFLFIQNFFTDQPSWFFPEAWSLSIEEWFYVCVPIIIFVLVNSINTPVKKAVLYTCIGVLISVTMFRLCRFNGLSISNYTIWDNQFRKQVITRLDSPMYGVLGAYIYYYYNTTWNRYKTPLLWGGILLFGVLKLGSFYTPINSVYFCVFSFSVTSIATLSLLPFLSEYKTGKGFIYKGLTTISLISYSMYLLNLSLIQRWILGSIDWFYFTDNFALIDSVKYILYWTLTLVLSVLLYKYVEVPMMKLRDK